MDRDVTGRFVSRASSTRANLAAVVVFILLTAFVGTVFLVTERGERIHTRETVTAVATQVAARLRDFHADRTHFLEALAADWSNQRPVRRAWFVEEVNRIRSGLAGIQAMAWIGPDHVVRWMAPGTPENLSIEGVSIRRRPLSAPVADAVARDGRRRITPPFELLQGGRGLIVYERLQAAGEFAGFLTLVYRVDAIEARLLRDESLGGYVFSVTDADSPILRRGDVDVGGPVTVVRGIPVADRTWTLHIAPATAPPAGPLVLLFVGLAFAALTAVYVRTLMLRDQALRAYRIHLEDLVVERTAKLEAAKEEAERANEAKGRFLAAASHDLRQPLQAANMFVHTLERQLRRQQDHALLMRIRRALGMLDSLLEGFLDISRLDAGTVLASPVVFELDSLLEQLADEYTAQAASRRLNLRFVPSGLCVRSDPVLLYRILVNLISNALRYTRSGGILVGCRRAGPDVRIQVLDTGEGIPEDKLGMVFEEFYQAGQAAPGTERGFGLGLAVVRRLADLLGHHVSIRSNVGRGTMVEVVVPRAFPARSGETINDRKADAAETLSATVMVIEDDAEVRDSLSLLLKAAGAVVVEGESAATAIAAARRRRIVPDVVLADLQLLDGESGIDAIHRVQAEFGPAAGVILTGGSDPDILARVTHAGLILLHKPVTASELVDALGEAMAEPSRGGGAAWRDSDSLHAPGSA